MKYELENSSAELHILPAKIHPTVLSIPTFLCVIVVY